MTEREIVERCAEVAMAWAERNTNLSLAEALDLAAAIRGTVQTSNNCPVCGGRHNIGNPCPGPDVQKVSNDK